MIKRCIVFVLFILLSTMLFGYGDIESNTIANNEFCNELFLVEWNEIYENLFTENVIEERWELLDIDINRPGCVKETSYPGGVNSKCYTEGGQLSIHASFDLFSTNWDYYNEDGNRIMRIKGTFPDEPLTDQLQCVLNGYWKTVVSVAYRQDTIIDQIAFRDRVLHFMEDGRTFCDPIGWECVSDDIKEISTESETEELREETE